MGAGPRLHIHPIRGIAFQIQTELPLLQRLAQRADQLLQVRLIHAITRR